MLRRLASVVVVSLLGAGVAPYAAQAAGHDMACCPQEPPCPQTTALRCCTMVPDAPATPAAPTLSSAAGQRDDVGVFVRAAVAPAIDAPTAASRAFTARQRCFAHDSPHLRLHVLLI